MGVRQASSEDERGDAEKARKRPRLQLTRDLLLVRLHLSSFDVARDDFLQIRFGGFSRIRVHQQSAEQLKQIL